MVRCESEWMRRRRSAPGVSSAGSSPARGISQLTNDRQPRLVRICRGCREMAAGGEPTGDADRVEAEEQALGFCLDRVQSDAAVGGAEGAEGRAASGGFAAGVAEDRGEDREGLEQLDLFEAGFGDCRRVELFVAGASAGAAAGCQLVESDAAAGDGVGELEGGLERLFSRFVAEIEICGGAADSVAGLRGGSLGHRAGCVGVEALRFEDGDEAVDARRGIERPLLAHAAECPAQREVGGGRGAQLRGDRRVGRVDDDGCAWGVDDGGAMDVVFERAALAAVALEVGEAFADLLVADGAVEDQVGGAGRSGQPPQPNLFVGGAGRDPWCLGAAAAVEGDEGELCPAVGSALAVAVVAVGEAAAVLAAE